PSERSVLGFRHQSIHEEILQRGSQGSLPTKGTIVSVPTGWRKMFLAYSAVGVVGRLFYLWFRNPTRGTSFGKPSPAESDPRSRASSNARDQPGKSTRRRAPAFLRRSSRPSWPREQTARKPLL